MARKENELFIGSDQLTIEGRAIKHPALIRRYANVNANKISKDLISIIAMDLETEAATGELKLLGFYDPSKRYNAYNKDFLDVLFMYIRYCKANLKSLAYWNRLDPFVLFKQFLLVLSEKEQHEALQRFGKVSGEWNRKDNVWNVKPVCEVKIGDQIFGIKNAIRSSVQFFYFREGDEGLNTVWAYDIAQLYPNGLEKEATKRFDYYSKIDESAHLVDWKRFDADKDYRVNIVLKSNMLDAMACHDLAIAIQNDFKEAFGFYPRTLISQGSLARSAIAADLYNQYEKHYPNEKALKRKVHEEMSSIGIINYKDKWVKEFGKTAWKDLNCLFTEAYSGGYIEAIRYGYSKSGWYADIASAYPGIIQNLYDLRNCYIRGGHGEPPKPKKGYCFIRGVVKIPSDVHYHPVTIKHPINKDTNIRAVGEYRAAYTYEEREFLRLKGARFYDEYYWLIETEGERSPLANVCMNFIGLRKRLKESGSSSEHMAKIAANSLYGILFEAVDTYMELETEKVIEHKIESNYKDILQRYKKNINLTSVSGELKYLLDNDFKKMMGRWHDPKALNYPESVKDELTMLGIHLEADNPTDIMLELENLFINDKRKIVLEKYTKMSVERNGYRAGEFWNPLYAAIITANTRLLMAKAADSIAKAGGKPILLMTDSVLWQGSSEMMPKEFVKEVKTLGFYEKPEQVSDIVCLGSGRYGYKAKDGYYTAKRRGLNAVDIHDPDGVPMTDFNWGKALEVMRKTGKSNIDIKVRTLVSPGLVLHNGMYKVKDLGRIVEETKSVDAIVGKSKRFYDESIKNPDVLATSLVDTRPIELNNAMFGEYKLLDQTLPRLREQLMKLEVKTGKEKKRVTDKKASRVYKAKNKNKLKSIETRKCERLKELGYTGKQAHKMKYWSNENIIEQLKKDGKVAA